MTDSLLNKIYTPLFDEDIVILELAMKSLQNLLLKCKNLKPLTEYLKDNMGKLMELSKTHQYPGTNVNALRIIESLHHHEPTLKILNRNYLIDVF